MDDLETRFRTRNRSPLMDNLGVRVVVEQGHPIVRVDIGEPHLRSHNIAHGGLLCTILDTAMGVAAYAALLDRNLNEGVDSESPDALNDLVTSQMTIHFLRPAWNGETIIGRGDIIHNGRKTIVVRGDVETAAGEPIASGSGTFMPVNIPATPEHPAV